MYPRAWTTRSTSSRSSFLFAPNTGITVLGFSWGVPVRLSVPGLTSYSDGYGGGDGDHSLAVSLLHRSDLSVWVWASVLIGLFAVFLLTRTVVRQNADRPAQVRIPVCFVAVFGLAALVTGVGLDVAVEGEGADLIRQLFAGDFSLPYGADAQASVGLSFPAALFGAAVWGALGVFAGPLALPFLRGVAGKGAQRMATATVTPFDESRPAPDVPADPYRTDV